MACVHVVDHPPTLPSKVFNTSVHRFRDPVERKTKRVVWDITDTETLQMLRACGEPGAELCHEVLIAKEAMEATRTAHAHATEEERHAFRSSWLKVREKLECFVASANLYQICDVIVGGAQPCSRPEMPSQEDREHAAFAEVKPMTHRFRCSWVSLVGGTSEEQAPKFFVSHWWGGCFKARRAVSVHV